MTQEETNLFGLHFHLTGHHWRMSEQELQKGKTLAAGADTEAMKAAYWYPPHSYAAAGVIQT